MIAVYYNVPLYADNPVRLIPDIGMLTDNKERVVITVRHHYAPYLTTARLDEHCHY